MGSDESDVDKTEWRVLDLRNDTVAIPFDIEDDSIVGQEVRASEGGTERGWSGPLGPFNDGEPQAKWTFGVLVHGPEGNKRRSIESAHDDPLVARSQYGSKVAIALVSAAQQQVDKLQGERRHSPIGLESARTSLTLWHARVHSFATMATFRHLVFNDRFELKAPPANVFPLLCPLREHEWIPTWKAEILYSQSGHAELDCTFTTDSPAEGKRIWICTRYEPDCVISYTSYSEAGYVMCLDITLRPVGNNFTEVTWLRRFVATSMSGQDWISALDPTAAAKATRNLASLLDHFLTTGAMLRA